jgi:peroxiredoxin
VTLLAPLRHHRRQIGGDLPVTSARLAGARADDRSLTAMTKIQVGDSVAPRELPTIRPGSVRVPNPDGIVHLQFRRYAGCPICTLHLRAFAARHDELAAAGVREVVVFHSDRESLLEHKADLPFDVVPDPGKALYREFGAERSLRAVLHPSSWLAGVRGWVPSLGVRAGAGGYLGLPADFLIEPGGRVLAHRYGTHANDQWSVDEVLALAHGRATT